MLSGIFTRRRPRVAILEKKRALKRLKNIPVEMSPFGHIQLENFFSAGTYKSLQQSLPIDDHYTWLDTISHQEHHRGRFAFTNSELKSLDESARVFWSDIKNWILSGPFLTMLLQKFQHDLSRRFDNSQEVRLAAELKLTRDRGGFGLDVHTDTVDRVASALFYLPESDANRESGTCLYAPIDEAFVCDGTRRHSFDKFYLAKKAAFVPNGGVCFFRTGNSFHGVPPVLDMNVRRDMLVLIVRELTDKKFVARIERSVREEEDVIREFVLRTSTGEVTDTIEQPRAVLQ